MFTRAFELFKMFGIPIRIDLSWFIIAILVTWSLAVSLFPQLAADIYPEVAEQLTPTAYWTMGVLGALGLFASVLLHELGHALEARRHGVEMRAITLFIFGGVAEMGSEPPTAKAEFLVAIAGPAVSLILAVLFIGTSGLIPLPETVTLVVGYLGLINLLLLVFNLIPAFPLDGGRVLRAALWHYKGDLRWATRITSSIGSGFGLFLIIIGVFAFIQGLFVQGMWYFLIGLFLRAAANMSYQQLLMRRALEGEPVERFMHREPRTVPSDTTLQNLVDDYLYRYNHKMFPVQDNGNLRGCVTLNQIKEMPREEWSQHTVSEIAQQCGPDNTISPDADAMEALSKMSQTGASRLLVVDREGKLQGILALKDLMGFISMKVELEDESRTATTR
ncbi:MAG: site-2 protease family protein [Phycisphaeraceae bacterium]